MESHDAPLSGWDKMTTSLGKKSPKQNSVNGFAPGLGCNIIIVTPTFIFYIERMIELTPYSHTAPSKCPGVKGQLQDSLTRRHDLSVVHQLQTFRPKSLKKNDWWILHLLYVK